MKKHIIKILITTFLLLAIAGAAGWLVAKRDLQATQIINNELSAKNEQYAISLAEANRQIEIANEMIIEQNELLADYSDTIGNLKQRLAESKSYGSYWWERAHPREFESLEELKAWLAEDDTDSTLYIFGYGCLDNYSCVDYAVALVYNALEDGYSVSTEIIGDHMINSTIIGNEIYFIEPQTDEVWFRGYR